MDADIQGTPATKRSRMLRRHYGVRWAVRTSTVQHHGEHNFIWTERGRFVLSRIPRTPKVPPYAYQFGIIEALRDAGFDLVYPPVPTLAEVPLVEDSSHYWFLRHFTAHDGLSSWQDPELVRKAARTLADLHQIGATCGAPVVGPKDATDAFNWSVSQVMENFDRVQIHFDGADLKSVERDFVLTAADDLRKQAAYVLDVSEKAGMTGLTHGDYRPANVLTRNGRVVNVVDWERARHDHHLHDASFAALQLMVKKCPCPRGCPGDATLTRLFLREYLAARGRKMPEVVPWMLRFVVLRRMLLNGRTRERYLMLRTLDLSGLTNKQTWK